MKKRPRIVLFAYSEVGCVCLEELIKRRAEIVCVFTHEDDPGEEIWFRSVKEIAQKHGIPVRASSKLGSEDIKFCRDLAPELIFSFYYRALIPKEILLLPRLGAYNMHGALLPRYRGRACVNWAVLNGETRTGATLHVMTEKPDGGDIVDSEAVEIKFTDTALDVFLKVAEAARAITERSLPALEAGTAPRTPQNEAEATYFGRRRPEDGRIDWNKSAREIYNLIRAVTHPFPGAFADIGGRKYYIWKARPAEGSAEPGSVVSLKPLVIGAGSGLLEVLSIQPEGGKEGDSLT
ncbi:MAG: formyltransferase [Synergistes sp.]|nr:formyltransferase [Synergistes sp.]